MCCRVDVSDFPSDPEVVSKIMKIGGFIELGNGRDYRRFFRDFPPIDDSLTRRFVAVNFYDREDIHGVKFELSPTIGHHTHEDHYRNRDIGAVVMKMAMTLAELSDACITQRGLMGDCREGLKSGTIVLAQYPHEPLRFENMCFGFREILAQGVAQDAPQTEPVAD